MPSLSVRLVPLLTLLRYSHPLMSSSFEEMHHLVGIREIAAMFGVSAPRAHQLTKTDNFPKPDVKLASGRIWKRAHVEKWAKATGRTDKAEG
jgi:predicted DNA-binding transcriptional regulator AlpA